MNVEILEYYPLTFEPKKQILEGTLRIKLTDLGIHVLGIHVSKRKDFWHFLMPGRRGVCHKTGQSIRYPFFSFVEKEKQDALIQAIRTKGQAFIEARLADTANPIVCPPKLEQAERPKTAAIPKPAPSKESAKEVPKVVKSIATKKWIDLPKKPTGARNSSKFARR